MKLAPLAFGALLVAACSDQPTEDANADAGVDAPATAMSVDIIPHACEGPPFAGGSCEAGVVTQLLPQGSSHVELPTPIDYADSPPASGNHRGQWARWGEYEYLPAQRWLHNLEHGGVAFLYNPCADQSVIDALRDFAKSRPDDDGGSFRWVMTPYPGLSTTVAAVAWTWTYEAECVDPADLDQFVANQYRRAPEDIGSDGAYRDLWIGK